MKEVLEKYPTLDGVFCTNADITEMYLNLEKSDEHDAPALVGVDVYKRQVYSHEGLVRKTNDIGYTYIEIDLTAQRMVFYKDGTPTADAQIVSGNPFVPNCATPVGCYTTGEMKSGCTVNGEDYPSAVNYWIPFDGNLGISDAPWRMDFGGQLYEFEGTHGSICAPSDQVQIIFSNVEKNTPIVIYE